MALGALSPRVRWPLGSTWSHIFDPVKSLHFEFVSMLIERQLKSNWAGCSRERWAPPVKTHLQSFNFLGFCFCLNCVHMDRQPKINWWARCSRVKWAPPGQNTSWRRKLKARNLGKTLQGVGGELSAVFKIGFSTWLREGGHVTEQKNIH